MKALIGVLLVSAALTLAMSWPVAIHPRDRIFGVGAAGRHHDPFTVMWQFANARPSFPYRQPLVDDAGALAARAAGPVAAYNLIVLLSFPLTALAMFLLARHLGLTPAASSISALAFAFAPPHLAHAAYHPHIAQTQWLPVYFLLLWMCVAKPGVLRAAAVVLAALTLAASNLYGAWIAAVVTPVVVAGVWIMKRPDRARAGIGVAGAAAAIGAGALVSRALLPRMAPDLWRYASDPRDLARYGAAWSSYFVHAPPDRTEQQIYLSYGLLALAAIAVWFWLRARNTAAADSRASMRAVPVLAALGFWAALCSLAPTFPFAPAGWLYEAAPMFRAYARFAFVVHLAVALLAGIGFTIVWRRYRIPAIALLAVAVIEYMPLPAQSRDVLPTAAHRWIATQPDAVRVLDCIEPSQEDALVPWLMQRRVDTLPAALPSCVELNVAQQAASLGYTHLISRGSSAERDALLAARAALTKVRGFDDAAVYGIGADAAPVTLLEMDGFFPLEFDRSSSWRWMGQRGEWIVSNTRPEPARVRIEMSLASHDRARRVSVLVDNAPVGELLVRPEGDRYFAGPFMIAPGLHRIEFVALEPASRASERDTRMVTVLLADWRWWP